MPTLDLPNLAAISYQKQTTPPPIAVSRQPVPIGSQAQGTTTTTPATSCQTGFNLCIEQGATLSVPIAVTIKDTNGVTQPVDITGNKFQFTAKTSPSVPDTDPSVVKVDWTETNTPTQGKTYLVVPSDVTTTMQAIPYFYQLRMVQSPTSPSPVVTPLFSGTLSVVQPISTRY
jgi:hypothetical protein